MKVNINREALLIGLQKVKHLYVAKPLTEILTNVVFRFKGPQLQLRYTDLEATVSMNIECEPSPIPGTESYLLPFEILIRTLELSSAPTIEIEFANGGARITAGNDVTNIPTLEASDLYPTPPVMPKEQPLKLGAEEILWLERALDMLENHNTIQPWKSLVCIDIKENDFTIVGTNASALLSKSVKHTLSVPSKKILLSKKVIRLLGGLQRCFIGWTDDVILIVSDTIAIAARVADVEYPKYESVIPERTEQTFTINRKELIQAVEQASVVIKPLDPIGFYSSKVDGQLQLQSAGASNAEKVINIPIAYSGATPSIFFSPAVLRQTLRNLPFENMIFDLPRPMGAALIRTPEDESYIGLMMPLMISSSTN